MGVSFLGLNLQKATWAVVVSMEIVTGATGLNAVLGVGVGGVKRRRILSTGFY